MFKKFIERPILSSVVSFAIIVLGGIGLYMLSIESYPDIAPPTVEITATYSGASADAVLSSVIMPLEEQINGVEGMNYMTSIATSSGSASITVFFKKGVDPDMAVVNVQNRVARATMLLPQEVNQIGVNVDKKQATAILMLTVSSENPDFDDKFIFNYSNINIIPEIQRITGVGSAEVMGAKDYSMRIWLKPDVMASYKISPDEVIFALKDQNIEAAAGELGLTGNQAFQYPLKYTGKLKTPEQFENVIIRNNNGQILRVKDVADVELGSIIYSVHSEMDKKAAAVISVNQTPGSNAQQIIKDVKKKLDEASVDFPPGLEITYIKDDSAFLSASISKVVSTLFEAFVLVFLVVFVFLQRFRYTVIPVVVVPISIIGAFVFMLLFGFTINILTLFALVLAIGTVVDDPIVVVEAVHAKIQSGVKNSKKATQEAMKEITPAIISITLVLMAVFLPVSFMGGTSGIFFRQFGLTIASAILISAVVALTLSPALCAKLFKVKPEQTEKKNFLTPFFDWFNKMFDKATDKYKSSLHFFTKKKHRWISVAIIVGCSGILFGLMRLLPSTLIPDDDSGNIMGIVSLPPGSSLERTDSTIRRVMDIIDGIPEVKNTISLTGISLMNGEGSSYGSFMLKLEPWNDRSRSSQQLTELLMEKTASMIDARCMFFAVPTITGFGMTGTVDVQIQDKTGGDILELSRLTNNFIENLKQRDEVMMVMTNFDPAFPQKQLDVNMAKVTDAGLTLSQVMGTLQANTSNMYVSNFNLYGKMYRVMIQSSPEFRTKEENLSGIFIRTKSGEMAPITEFITITDVTGAHVLKRFNMYTSVDIMIVPNYMGGYGTGDILAMMDKVAEQELPLGYGYEYSGLTREESESGNTVILIFAVCLVFVYIILAGLYESYLLPLAVIFSLPVGLAGVFIFILGALLTGTMIVNNIYVQISMVMLIGLLAKNAILIVEYAIQRRKQGMSVVDSAIGAGVARLRPILMTSFTCIFGLLPLAIATGAGSMGNKSIGLSAIGGMLIGTVIGIFIIPTLYIMFQSLDEKLNKNTDLDEIE